MQGQSPKVLDGSAVFGELRDSLNWEVCGSAEHGKNPAKPLVGVPVHWEKFWIVKRKEGDKWYTERMERMDSSNNNLDPWETWSEDGVQMKRIYLHMVYFMLEGKVIPYSVGFRGTSKKAGDGLVTQMYVINKALKVDAAWKRSPMAKVMRITPTKQTKEGNTFIVLEAAVERDATFEEACDALNYQKLLKRDAVKVDHSDILNEGKKDQFVSDNAEF